MLKKIFNVSVYVFAVFGFIFTLLIFFWLLEILRMKILLMAIIRQK